jgi:glutamyl-tRNA synthetase
MTRVRFAPSPTGFLHIGSARTFIFNWLYARHHSGVVVLRIDDTDVDRNSQASLDSIFEGLKWLDLNWDEEYRQSDRGDLHRQMAWKIFEKGLAYRDFTPAGTGAEDRPHGEGAWLFNPGSRELAAEESQRRADSGETFVLRFRVPRDRVHSIEFRDGVYADQSKSTADIEDFALLRSNGVPTYHMASCADDIDLNITHIIRGQDHLTNTFKHILILEALGAKLPQFAHLPLLIAPDGSKLSKRKHGPVVSVTTYRDAGFLAQAYINFLCLLGWSPKDDREKMSRQELISAFSFEGINRDNAVVNFSDTDPFDAKALWLNAEYIREMNLDDLAARLRPFLNGADPVKIRRVAPLVRERIKLLSDVHSVAGFFFADQLAPYDPAELIPQKGDREMARKVLEQAHATLAKTDFTHDALDAALRADATRLQIKPGQMFQPIRVAVCGQKAAPPLFETLEVIGQAGTLTRIDHAIALIRQGDHGSDKE